MQNVLIKSRLRGSPFRPVEESRVIYCLWNFFLLSWSPRSLLFCNLRLHQKASVWRLTENWSTILTAELAKKKIHSYITLEILTYRLKSK